MKNHVDIHCTKEKQESGVVPVPITPAFERLVLDDDHKSEPNVGYKIKPCLKRSKRKYERGRNKRGGEEGKEYKGPDWGCRSRFGELRLMQFGYLV